MLPGGPVGYGWVWPSDGMCWPFGRENDDKPLDFWVHYIWLVVTGTWMDYDFPFSWECHHPNWRTHIFQRGRSTTKLNCQVWIDSSLGWTKMLHWRSLLDWLPRCHWSSVLSLQNPTNPSCQVWFSKEISQIQNSITSSVSKENHQQRIPSLVHHTMDGTHQEWVVRLRVVDRFVDWKEFHHTSRCGGSKDGSWYRVTPRQDTTYDKCGKTPATLQLFGWSWRLVLFCPKCCHMGSFSYFDQSRRSRSCRLRSEDSARRFAVPMLGKKRISMDRGWWAWKTST